MQLKAEANGSKEWIERLKRMPSLARHVAIAAAQHSSSRSFTASSLCYGGTATIHLPSTGGSCPALIGISGGIMPCSGIVFCGFSVCSLTFLGKQKSVKKCNRMTTYN